MATRWVYSRQDGQHAEPRCYQTTCREVELTRKLLKRLVRPEGLEPPAYWFEAINPRNIYNLAGASTIAKHYSKLLVFKHFREVRAVALATARNASVQGVGTKMGTVRSRDSGGQGQANIRTSGPHGTFKTYKTWTGGATT